MFASLDLDSSPESPSFAQPAVSFAILPGERKKKWAPKVKTGCRTCRMRHVKCDETRPACIKCSNSGRRCDGYVYTLGRSAAETGTTSSGKLINFTQPAPRVCPPQLKASPEEIGLFNYFRIRIPGEMAGAFDKTYWGGHLLQMIHQQPAVWHACNAMAALHQVYISIPKSQVPEAKRTNPIYVTGLKQYHESLKNLIKITAQDTLSLNDKITVLATNMLFVTLSWFRGDMVECAKHITNGMVLISRWKLWTYIQDSGGPPAENLAILEYVLLTYLRADGSSMTSRDPKSSKVDSLSLPPVVVDRTFYSPGDAYFELEFIWNAVMKVVRRGPLVITEQPECYPLADPRLSFRPILERWRRKLGDFEISRRFKDVHIEAMAILKMRHMFLEILLNLDTTLSELCWDVFEAEFSDIVRFAAMVSARLDQRDIEPRHGENQGPKQGLGLVLTMIEPLYLVVWRCRNSPLRHEALEILMHEVKRNPGRQRMMYPKLCELIVSTEEQAWLYQEQTNCDCIVGSWVCINHRVVYNQLQWEADGSSILRLRTLEDIKNNYPMREFTVPSWT